MKLPTLKNEYELNRWMRDRLSCTETTTFICPFNIATYFAILAHMSLHFWKNKQGGTTKSFNLSMRERLSQLCISTIFKVWLKILTTAGST